MKNIFNFLLIPALLLLISCQEKVSEPELSIKEFQEHINYLASEKLEGRFPGTKGDRLAAKYIRNDFRSNHLKLLGDQGMQQFLVVTGTKVSPDNFLEFENYKGEQYKDFVPFPFSGSSSFSAVIEFTGYGFEVENKKFKWNDYSGVDLSGKWALIIRGMPDIGEKKQYFMAQKSDRSKALMAEEKGAEGILFVSSPGNAPEDKLVDPTLKEGNIGIPVIHIKRSVANRILKEQNYTVESICNEYLKNEKPDGFTINKKLKADIAVKPNEVQTQNIIAEINIDSETDTNEYIVIGAHYDHLGKGGPESGSRRPDTVATHYGADDNASGLAAMLEIAEKLNSIKDSLDNNYLFIAFGAEEMGLIGSKYYTSHPLIEMDRVKAMINIDMIGRLKDNNEVQIGGTGTSENIEDILNLINNNYSFNMGFSKEGYGPSDHSSFYTKDIPVFFISTGPHLDYHTPADTPEKINYEGIQKLSKYILQLSREVANDSTVLAFREAGQKSEERKARRRDNLKVTLGIMPDFAGIEDRGLRADVVIKGKTADLAGMKEGDIITAINGHKIRGIYDYMERLSKLKPGQTITIEIIREDEKKVLMVQL